MTPQMRGAAPLHLFFPFSNVAQHKTATPRPVRSARRGRCIREVSRCSPAKPSDEQPDPGEVDFVGEACSLPPLLRDGEVDLVNEVVFPSSSSARSGPVGYCQEWSFGFCKNDMLGLQVKTSRPASKSTMYLYYEGMPDFPQAQPRVIRLPPQEL